MNIDMTHKNGIILKTAGKYCLEDIQINPDLPLQDKALTITKNDNYEIVADDTQYALSRISIDVNVPVHEVYLNAEGREF